MLRFCFCLVFLNVWSAVCPAAEYHLSPSGNDASDGSQGTPWRTLAHATASVIAGDTVWLHTGTWNERLVPTVSGAAGALISFRAASGEEAVIDGTGIAFTDISGLVDLTGRSYIRIEGLKIRNYTTAVANRVPVGVLIQGESVGCEIIQNEITQIASTVTVNAQLLGRDAHGIAVYGSSAIAISKILIRGNELMNLTLGSSEAMVINGNVDDFRVLENHVHHCDNIGIDAIGFEGTSPNGATDQARNGVIAGNHVHDITSAGNPAYTDTSAGGIYVDGGKDIVIERNHVHHCDIGVEVASEHQNTATENITVRSNIIRENLMAGLFIGGYNNNSTGDAENCKITNNTFYNNDTDPNGDEYGQIYLQYRVKNCTFSNNILYHSISKGDPGDQRNTFIIHWNTTGTNNKFDHNLFYGTDTPVWVLNDVWIEGWSDYDNHALSGADEAWGDPGFFNVLGLDFTPTIKDTGDDGEVSAADRDFNGKDRKQGSNPDRGAIEVGSIFHAEPSLQIIQIGATVALEWNVPLGYYMDLEYSEDLEIWHGVPGEDSVVSDALPRQRVLGFSGMPRIFYRVRMH